MIAMENLLAVKFFTVNGQIPVIKCDSVRLPVADKLNGEFSGYYGIRKGHARTVFALKAGNVTATLNEKTVFSAEITDGFAIVENNEVSITVDKVTE